MCVVDDIYNKLDVLIDRVANIHAHFEAAEKRKYIKHASLKLTFGKSYTCLEMFQINSYHK